MTPHSMPCQVPLGEICATCIRIGKDRRSYNLPMCVIYTVRERESPSIWCNHSETVQMKTCFIMIKSINVVMCAITPKNYELVDMVRK